jgi:hypothetical protein
VSNQPGLSTLPIDKQERHPRWSLFGHQIGGDIMNSVKAVRLTGDRITLDGASLEKLKSSLRGALLAPGDEGYDKARTVLNAMIDRKLALVMRCAGVADIRRAVTFAHRRHHDHSRVSTT